MHDACQMRSSSPCGARVITYDRLYITPEDVLQGRHNVVQVHHTLVVGVSGSKDTRRGGEEGVRHAPGWGRGPNIDMVLSSTIRPVRPVMFGLVMG